MQVMTSSEREFVREATLSVLSNFENQAISTRDIMTLLEGENSALRSLMHRKGASSAVGSILFTMARNNKDKRYRNVLRVSPGKYMMKSDGTSTTKSTEQTSHKVVRAKTRKTTMRYKFIAKRDRSVIIEDTDGNLYEAYPLKTD